MCYWCGHCPHCGRGYGEPEYAPPRRRRGWGPRYPRAEPEEEAAGQVEEQRDELERRLRRLEAQIAELRKGGHSG